MSTIKHRTWRYANVERWISLCERLAIKVDTSVYELLVSRYSEPHRHYHTLTHVDAMLSHFDHIRSHLDNDPLVELAIWFHDAIYQPFSSNNEKESADWAVAFLEASFLNTPSNEESLKQLCTQKAASLKTVEQLIMSTCHQGAVRSMDEKYLIDIDLSILGACEKVYEQYEKNIRKEYRWVPYFLYRKKRTALLQSFLERPSIYHTRYGKSRWESNARRNLKRAIKELL